MVHLLSPAPVNSPTPPASPWPRPSTATTCSLQKVLPAALLEALSDAGACFQAWQAIPHSCGNAGVPPEPPPVGRVMLMGTCSGSTWRRAGAGSGAGPFLEAVCITAEASFDSLLQTNMQTNQPTLQISLGQKNTITGLRFPTSTSPWRFGEPWNQQLLNSASICRSLRISQALQRYLPSATAHRDGGNSVAPAMPGLKAAHNPRHAAGSLTLPKQPHAAGSCLGQTEQDRRDV